MAKLMDRLIGIVTRISEWLDLISEWLAKRSTPLVESAEEGRNISLEEVVSRIEKSVAWLADAVKRSASTVEEKTAADEGPEPALLRDETWWALLAREDWNLIGLSWDLRGVILKRGQQQAAKEMGPG